MTDSRLMLRARGVTRAFPVSGGKFWALRGIDADIPAGALTILKGRSGSGKTTLLNILSALDRPTAGEVLFDGQDVARMSEDERTRLRRRRIGFVFQSFHLLPKLTALDNVALPLLYGGVKKEERRERARAALETVGLADRIDHRPDQLSGGQCQRVAIARAIVGKPRLLLADEPTGALDSASGAQVMELFHQLHADGSTIIMITHDRGIAHHADTIMTIKDGVLSGGENDE